VYITLNSDKSFFLLRRERISGHTLRDKENNKLKSTFYTQNKKQQQNHPHNQQLSSSIFFLSYFFFALKKSTHKEEDFSLNIFHSFSYFVASSPEQVEWNLSCLWNAL
jgi:hypothetical protein